MNEILNTLLNFMEDEINGAMEYAKAALKFKYLHCCLSQHFFKIAKMELAHFEILRKHIDSEMLKEITNSEEKESINNHITKMLETAKEVCNYLHLYN